MVTLCQDAKAHVLHVLHLMLHVPFLMLHDMLHLVPI
jgi:hypothetical protein